VIEAIHKEFYGMYKSKSLHYLENKIKNIRYIAELIKFKLAPPIFAFKVFKNLLLDFSHHNVDLLAALLEGCGRYLYLLPYTHRCSLFTAVLIIRSVLLFC
jgi:regulator of nonsense transcripts 2